MSKSGPELCLKIEKRKIEQCLFHDLVERNPVKGVRRANWETMLRNLMLLMEVLVHFSLLFSRLDISVCGCAYRISCKVDVINKTCNCQMKITFFTTDPS